MENSVLYQRWIALGLLLLVLCLLIFLLVIPITSTGMEYYEQKNELIFRLKRSNQIVAQKQSVTDNIERISAQHQQQNYYSTQGTVALASADLQRFIKSTISDAGGQLTSTQVLPSKSADGFNRITVKVRMSGDVDVLRSVLQQIESATPIMVIGQIDIRPVRGKRNRKTRKIEPSNKLNINFQATGFMREVRS